MAGKRKIAPGLKDRFKKELGPRCEELMQSLRNEGIPDEAVKDVFDGMPALMVAIKQAALLFNPIDPEIMRLTREEVNSTTCIELIESNPEYLSAPFATYYLKINRILLYHPDERIKDDAMEWLRRVSDAILQKDRDHIPDYFIAWHRNNIRETLKQNKKAISNVQDRLKFLKNHFCLEPDDNYEDPPVKVTELATYVTARLYGLTQDTVSDYAKRGTSGFDIELFERRIKAIIAGL